MVRGLRGRRLNVLDMGPDLGAGSLRFMVELGVCGATSEESSEGTVGLGFSVRGMLMKREEGWGSYVYNWWNM